MKKTISNLVENEYKPFAKYVCFERAIPHLIDGFKPVQRKAFFCAKSMVKFIKVMALSGKMIAESNYHHGDASASNAISSMAKDFTGSNNIPVFLKDGSFGNRFITKASAPRYIYVKPNPLYYRLYKDSFLHVTNDDPDSPEPKFYLPIIPTILLNGISGIAVGFATDILPYHIKEIIKLTEEMIKDGYISDQNIMPYFNGYSGNIEWDIDNQKWVMYGVYEILNTTTIHITEVPIHLDREKYIKHLNKLIDKGLIKSFIENSKGTWDIKIKLTRNSKLFEDPIEYLKLRHPLKENLTVIDQNDKIKVFNDPIKIIEEFVKYRLQVYCDRRAFMLNKLKEDIFYTNSKIKFIKLMCWINFKKMTKQEIKDAVLERGCEKDHLIKHMEIKVHALNITEIEKCKELIIELTKEYKWYKKITSKELYNIDINELKEKLS